jgi:hypothetical protein
MRKFMLLALIFVATISSNGQQANPGDEKKIQFRIDDPAEWYELNNRREILTDTLFTTNGGFRINSEIRHIKIKSEDYVIIEYPDWKNGKQLSRDAKRPELSWASLAPYVKDLSMENGKKLCMKLSDFDALKKSPVYGLRSNFKIVAGQLSIPFKLRPKVHNTNFQMTTDVTVGAYGGPRWRISRINSNYLTVPITAGLSFININDNSTTIASPTAEDTKIVPGVTWSSGLILQLGTINVGVVFGADYAAQSSNEWLYNRKLWYSFAIGFAFLK